VSRGLLIGVVVLFVCLAGFYYFVDIRGRDVAEAEASADRRLTAEFDPLLVGEVIVEPDGGPLLQLVSDGDGEGWRLVDPLPAEADPEAVGRLLDTLGRLASAREPFVPTGEGLEPYGLDPPRLVVTLAGEGLDRPVRLALGGHSTYGDFRYALVRDTNLVGLVPDGETGTIPQTLFDLREKRLVRFEREAVRELRVESEGRPALVIRRLGDDWEIVEPLHFAADRELVGNLLWELTESLALEFPADAALAVNLHLVTLDLADGSRVEARFGLPDMGEGLAAVSGAGPVMTVDETILHSLARPAEAWRQMRPFPRYAWEVDRLAVGDRSWEKDGTGDWDERLDRAVELLTGLEACGLAMDEESNPDFTVALGADVLEIRFPTGEAAPDPCAAADRLILGRRPGAEQCLVIDSPRREELREILVELATGE